MRKRSLWSIILLFCLFLAACGEEEISWRGIAPGTEDLTVLTDRTEYYDITVEEEDFDLGLWEKNPQDQQMSLNVTRGGTGYIPIGAQFYKGEPVQLWAERSRKVSSVWLYRQDGSGEIVLQEAPFPYIGYRPDYQWYLSQEGDFYCYGTVYEAMAAGEYKDVSTLVKISPSGEVLYRNKLEAGAVIQDICQLEDGKIYLQVQEGSEEAPGRCWSVS